jgi:hypothetical protein
MNMSAPCILLPTPMAAHPAEFALWYPKVILQSAEELVALKDALTAEQK